MTEGRGGRLYYPALDTLRGMFSLTVMLFHALIRVITNVDPPQFAPVMRGVAGAGAFGVPFFFVLSAFLITNLLMEESQVTGKVHVGRFYLRRILRVWPVYYVVLLGALFIVEPALGHPAPQWLVPFGAFYANNLMGSALEGPSIAFAPLWSVSIEEQFYAVWPWIARWAKPPVMAAAGILLVLVGIVSRQWLFELGVNNHPKIWFLTWTHLDSLGLGVLAALAHRHLNVSWLQRNLNWVAWVCLGTVLGVQQATSTLIDIEHLNPVGIWAYVAVPLSAAVLVVAAAQPAESVGPFWKSRVGLWFGRISYSLYAFHGWAVSWWGTKTGHTWAEVGGMVGLIVVTSVGLGAMGH